VRLQKSCDWTPRWKFIDQSRAVAHDYSVSLAISSRYTHSDQTDLACPSEESYHSSLSTDSRQSEMASKSRCDKEPGRNSTFPAMFTFVNHFPEDFDQLRNDEDMSDDRKEMAPTTYQSRKVRRSTGAMWDMQYQSSRLQPDISPCGFRAVQSARDDVLAFDRVISYWFAPVASCFGHSTSSVTAWFCVVGRKHSFIRHAMDAIILLNQGLEKQSSDFMVQSLYRYDQAITTSRSGGSEISTPELRFHLHCILLVYDVTCASHRWSCDRNYWTLHLPMLVNLLQDPSMIKVTRLQASLRWLILLLDAQAGLTGAPGSGFLVDSFLRGLILFPTWFNCTDCQFDLLGLRETRDGKIHVLIIFLCRAYASTSHIVRHLLEAASQHVGQGIEDNICKQLCHIWEGCFDVWKSRLSDMSLGEKEDYSSRDRAHFPFMIDFAKLQYYILCLHLSKFMRRGRQLVLTRVADQEESICRASIINLARQHLTEDVCGNFLLAHGLFTAYATSRDACERAEIYAISEEMDSATVGDDLRRAKWDLAPLLEEQTLTEQEVHERFCNS
jgi:hypothetical protein